MVDHVKMHLDGRIHVWQLDRGVQRFILKEFSPTLDDIDANSRSELFHSPGNAFTLCPFFRFDFDDAAFSCDIHGPVQPRACTSFFCAGSGRFGVEMEYCNPCWIQDADTTVPGLNPLEKIPPCEIGNGCRDITYRILFFLAYAKRHHRDPGLPDHALYLLGLMEKNEATFTSELKNKGLDPRDILANVEPLVELKQMLARLCDPGKRILDLEQ